MFSALARYSSHQLFGDGFQHGFDAVGIGDAALRHIFTAAAAAAQFRHCLFQQRAHVKGLARGLREHQRRLRRRICQQRDRVG
jgi:hypothetical protein